MPTNVVYNVGMSSLADMNSSSSGKARLRRQEGKRLYLEVGMTMGAVAQHLGVCRRTVERWAASEGWTKLKTVKTKVLPPPELHSDSDLSPRQRKRVASIDPFHSQDWVYFILDGSGSYLKIGRSTDPLARLKTIQTSSPGKLRLLLVLPGSNETEKFFHDKFSQHRANGEWFKVEGELELLVNLLKIRPSKMS